MSDKVTIGDVYRTMRAIRESMGLFGVTEKALLEYDSLVKQIGIAVCADFNVFSEEALKLSRDQVLKPNAQARYDALLTWWSRL